MENPIKDLQYFIDMYCKQYQLEQQNDIKDCLSNAYDELVDLRKSKICLNQYLREIATLKKNAQSLQCFSSEKIILDKLPKHHTEIYFYMSRYLFNMYQINYETSSEIFIGMYGEIFKEEMQRKPKVTKNINEMNEILFSTLEKLPLMNEKWLKICKDNNGKSLKELKEIFIKDTKLQ